MTGTFRGKVLLISMIAVVVIVSQILHHYLA